MTIATIQAAANTTAGNQDITTSKLGGLTPGAALITVSYGVTNGTSADGCSFGIGWTDGTDEFCMAYNQSHGETVQTDTAKSINDAIIWITNDQDQSLVGKATFVSWITNGIRINWASGEAPGSAYLIQCLFFATTNMQAKAIAITPNSTQDGTVDVTTIGFEADVVFGAFGIAAAGPTYPSSGGHIRGSFGIAYNGGTLVQRATGWQDRNGVTITDCRSNCSETYFLRNVGNTGTSVEVSYEIGSFDSQGFTITTRDGARNDTDIFCLALRLPQVSVSLHTTTTPTSIGEQTDNTPGFEPEALIVGPTLQETIDVITAGPDGGSLGLAFVDDTNIYSCTMASEDAITLGSTNTQNLTDTKINIPFDDGTAGVVAEMPTGNVFGASGYTFDYTTVDTGGGKKWWVMAFSAETPEPPPDQIWIPVRYAR